MFFPKTAEYAIRCMAQIALLPWEASITAEDLHEIIGVPRDYLSKILRRLSTAGLLRAEKGHGGGFRLSSPPSSISFLKILEAIGFSFNPNHCAFGWGSCNPTLPCPLHDTFSKLNAQFFQWASSTTLADVSHTTEVVARLRAARSPVQLGTPGSKRSPGKGRAGNRK